MSNNDKQNSSNKFNKLPLAELHPEFIKQLATVHKVGKEKGYSKYSWLNTELFPTIEILNAAMRHINAHLAGDLYNQEEGCTTKGYHLTHAAYNLLIAATQIKEQENDK